jgi:DnaJ-class molecular chaperone
MLTVDFKNGKKGFDGNVITTQHTVYWGGNQIGLYAAPYLSIRYGGNAGFNQDYYGLNHSANPTKSTAIGIKIGIYLTNGDEESKSSGTVNISSGGAAGTSINNTTNTRTNEPTTCTSCNGKGTYTCTRCGGNGRIADVKGSGSSNCNSCNGKGYHTCIVCNGKGKK